MASSGLFAITDHCGGRANAGFGAADLVTSALQQAARLREAGVSTLMIDTEQGAMQLGLA